MNWIVAYRIQARYLMLNAHFLRLILIKLHPRSIQPQKSSKRICMAFREIPFLWILSGVWIVILRTPRLSKPNSNNEKSCHQLSETLSAEVSLLNQSKILAQQQSITNLEFITPKVLWPAMENFKTLKIYLSISNQASSLNRDLNSCQKLAIAEPMLTLTTWKKV